MARTIIHVNQHVVRKYGKTGSRDPVLTVKQGRTNTYATAAEVLGPCRVVYSPDCPLKCGRRSGSRPTPRCGWKASPRPLAENPCFAGEKTPKKIFSNPLLLFLPIG
jgi:hypothetical protein